jgi:hypothetical protein
MQAHVKLRRSVGDRNVLWWIRAMQYAVVDNLLTPLYVLLNASFQQFDMRVAIFLAPAGLRAEREPLEAAFPRRGRGTDQLGPSSGSQSSDV